MISENYLNQNALVYTLYIDDGLMVTNRSKCEQERIGKHLRSIFKEHGFDITIEKGLFQTDFRHWIKFARKYIRTIQKVNAKIKYINNESNHPLLEKLLTRLSTKDWITYQVIYKFLMIG